MGAVLHAVPDVGGLSDGASGRRGRGRALRLAALSAVVLAPAAAFGQFVPQPVGHNSTIDAHGYDFTSVVLPLYVNDLIAPNGVPAVHDATMIFGNNFGGGMVDGFARTLPPALPYNLASASQYNELAYRGGTPTLGTYGSALFADMNLLANLVTMDALLQGVTYDDPAGPGGLNLEHPQLVSNLGNFPAANPGGNPTLALLFGGADDEATWEELQRARAQISTWASFGVDEEILMYFGDGVHQPNGQPMPVDYHVRPAQFSDVVQGLQQLKPTLTSDTRFFFYATGGGGIALSKGYPDIPNPTPGGTYIEFSLPLGEDELQALISDPDNYVYFNASWDGFGHDPDTDKLSFYLNGHLIGTAITAYYALQFLGVNEAYLTTENILRIVNNSSSDLYFTGVGLYSGSLAQPVLPEPVPEPASWAFLLLSPALLRRRLRSRRRS